LGAFVKNATNGEEVSRKGATGATTEFVSFFADFAAWRETNLRACRGRDFAHKGGMATTASTPAAAPTLKKRLEPYLTPYYFFYASVLGALTVGFVVLTLIIVMVATNFNILSLIE
jgi:hypothetical protein